MCYLRAEHLTMKLPGMVTAAGTATIVGAMLIAQVSGFGSPQERARAERQPANERLTLGIVRADGILLPFASFNGEDWKAPWPADLAGRDLPANLDAVPDDWWGGAAPERWRLWARDNPEPKPIKPVMPVALRIGVMRRLGLRTDLPAAMLPVPPFAIPFPKVGLAVAGDVDVKPIVNVSLLAPTWQQLLASIRADILSTEDRTIGGLRTHAGWKHPFDKNARQKIEPVVEAWYTSEIAGSDQRVSYIEAVKKYPPGPRDEGCGLESLISGWVHHDDRQARPKTRLKVAVTYCDRDKASYMLPFGQIRVRDRTHWIFQMSGQDHEWYEVAELTPGRVRFVAEYQGGGDFRPAIIR